MKKNMCYELTKPACSGCGWWQVREKMTNPSWVDLSWFPQHGHGLHLSSVYPAILWSLMKWQEPFVTSSSNRKVCLADNLEFVGCCKRQIGGSNFTWDDQTMHATPQTCKTESINQIFMKDLLVVIYAINYHKKWLSLQLEIFVNANRVRYGEFRKDTLSHYWSCAESAQCDCVYWRCTSLMATQMFCACHIFCGNQNKTLRFLFSCVHDVGLEKRVFIDNGILHRFQHHIQFRLVDRIRICLDLQ